MYFDGVDDYVSVAGMTASNNYFGACTISATIYVQDVSTAQVVWSLGGSCYRLYINAGVWILNAATSTSVPVVTGLQTVSVTFNASGEATAFSTTAGGSWTGTAPAGGSPLTVFLIGTRNAGAGVGLFFNGLIYDFSITGSSVKNFAFNGYGNTNADWEDQVGSNNGTVNGSPELFTGQGFDGTVSKWYDQSGNDNHAVQTTPANQPTIVEGGSLVTGGIDFDGVDDFFEIDMTGVNAATNLSTFNVITPTLAAASNTNTMVAWSMGNFSIKKSLAFASSTGLLSGEKIISIFDDGTENRLGSSTYVRLANETSLLSSFNLSSGTSLFAQSSPITLDLANGITTSSPSSPSDTGYVTDDIVILGAIRGNSNVAFVSEKFAEVIFYPSDQSDNRTAIEANIGEYYGITGIPAYTDTVDGFVETWYDQSGNGNDATQSVAGSQPKIVDGGSLVSGGIDFDGVDDCLETTYGSSEYTSFRVHRYKGSGAGIAYGLGGEVNRHNSSANNTQLTAYFGGSAALTDSGDGATEYLGYMYFNASNSTLHRIAYNDNALSSAGGSTAGTNPLVLMNIGAEKGIGANIFGNTTLKEIIFYDSDKSTERADISDNINAHYNIYP